MFHELEEKIVELEGIISCKITGDDMIDEIHIIANKERNPKRIVRDIETMVLVNLNQEIDHKKISIAQVNSRGEISQANRVEIISIYQENNRPVYHFRLNLNDELVEKEINASPEEPLPLIVAQGMIELVEEYNLYKGKLRVENVFTTGINNEILIVQLNAYQNGSLSDRQRLLGAVYINNDLPLAVGKACLKALNRRLN